MHRVHSKYFGLMFKIWAQSEFGRIFNDLNGRSINSKSLGRGCHFPVWLLAENAVLTPGLSLNGDCDTSSSHRPFSLVRSPFWTNQVSKFIFSTRPIHWYHFQTHPSSVENAASIGKLGRGCWLGSPFFGHFQAKRTTPSCSGGPKTLEKCIPRPRSSRFHRRRRREKRRCRRHFL